MKSVAIFGTGSLYLCFLPCFLEVTKKKHIGLSREMSFLWLTKDMVRRNDVAMFYTLNLQLPREKKGNDK